MAQLWKLCKSHSHKAADRPLPSGWLLDVFVEGVKKKKAGMLGKYLPNSLAVHAVMLYTQQDSAQIHLQHHRTEAASAPCTGSVAPVCSHPRLCTRKEKKKKKSWQDSCFLIILLQFSRWSGGGGIYGLLGTHRQMQNYKRHKHKEGKMTKAECAFSAVSTTSE